MIHFPLKTEYIELSKLLKAAGLCESGGIAGHAVAHGLVKVDGQTERRRGRKIRPGQRVEYLSEEIILEPKQNLQNDGLTKSE